MKSNIIFSKKNDDWATPTDLILKLYSEFELDLDPCPLNHNIKEFDGLDIEWNGNVFINPPYSNIKAWLEKGIKEFNEGRATTLVYLVPSRTDTKWFHDLVLANNFELRFVKGRLKFGNSKHNAPFPSVILIKKAV